MPLNKRMSRQEFLKEFSEKLAEWGRELSFLEDDVLRDFDKAQGDYEELLQKLDRNYGELELRAVEMERMSDERFKEIRTIVEDEIALFIQDLKDARKHIKNI